MNIIRMYHNFKAKVWIWSQSTIKVFYYNEKLIKEEIQDYFTGRIDYSEAINDDLRENTREKQYLAKRKKPEGLIEKKEKIEGENDGDEEYKKYLEQIRKWERVLETKNGKMRRNKVLFQKNLKKYKSFFWCLELLEARQKNKTTGGNSDQLRNQTL